MDTIRDHDPIMNDAAAEAVAIGEQMQEQLHLTMESFSEMQDAKAAAAMADTAQTITDAPAAEAKEGIQEVADWLPEINPKYDPFDSDPSYENNCGCCAFAVSRRLDGAEGISAGPDNIGTDEGMEGITGHKIVETTKEEIELTLMEQGAGAHCIVGINRWFGPGHWFNAYYDGKKVYYVDGQCNKISDWPPRGLGLVRSWVMEKKGV